MFFIAPERSTGGVYGFQPDAPEHSILAQLLFLLDVARLTTQCEIEHGIVTTDQQSQRLTLEFLVHLVGTGVVPLSLSGEPQQLQHRMHLHMAALGTRLRAVGQRFQSHGDLAYLRETWMADTLFSGDRSCAQAHPLFDTRRVTASTSPIEQQLFTLLNVANGMSIFHYIEGLQAVDSNARSLYLSFVRQLWADIVIVYVPLVGSTVEELLCDGPVDMENLLLRYFELTKRPGVVVALTALLERAISNSSEVSKIHVSRLV